MGVCPGHWRADASTRVDLERHGDADRLVRVVKFGRVR
jgi:hypothetical protein